MIKIRVPKPKPVKPRGSVLKVLQPALKHPNTAPKATVQHFDKGTYNKQAGADAATRDLRVRAFVDDCKPIAHAHYHNPLNKR